MLQWQHLILESYHFFIIKSANVKINNTQPTTITIIKSNLKPKNIINPVNDKTYIKIDIIPVFENRNRGCLKLTYKSKCSIIN